jgi:hypothetical protein
MTESDDASGAGGRQLANSRRRVQPTLLLHAFIQEGPDAGKILIRFKV